MGWALHHGRTLAATALVCSVLAGCGGDDQNAAEAAPPSTAAPSEEPAATPTPTPAPAPVTSAAPPPPTPLPPVLARGTLPLEDENGYRADLDIVWYEVETADGVQEAYDCGLTARMTALPGPQTLDAASIRVVRVDMTLRPQSVGGFTWDRDWDAELFTIPAPGSGVVAGAIGTSAGDRWPCSGIDMEPPTGGTLSLAWYALSERTPNAPDGDWVTSTGASWWQFLRLRVSPVRDCSAIDAAGFRSDSGPSACVLAPLALEPAGWW